MSFCTIGSFHIHCESRCLNVNYRKAIGQDEQQRMHQMVYDYLKEQKIKEAHIKRDRFSGLIGDTVDEITINQPTLVMTHDHLFVTLSHFRSHFSSFRVDLLFIFVYLVSRCQI